MLLSVRQTAEKLNLSEITVRRLIKFKRISYRKIGDRYLFSQEDISSYLESVKVPAVSSKKEVVDD
jgi:excisionase family DNA binding protein